LCGQADALGDAGDEETALVLDEAVARTRRILKARLGPPETRKEIAAAAVGLAQAAEALEEEGDSEAAGLFCRFAARLLAILDGRTGPCDLRRGPRDSYQKSRERGTGNRERENLPKKQLRQAPPQTAENKGKNGDLRFEIRENREGGANNYTR
jgi:hypothetical protein